MKVIEQLLDASAVHESWRPLLSQCLRSMDQDYLESLWQTADWLPGKSHLLAAFRQHRNQLAWILFGESPYPRPQSSVGIAFLDAAVDRLWSDKGLSTAVNRATSLRNLLKCMLVADGLLEASDTSQQRIAGLDKSTLVETIDELFANLAAEGFLMLNATPVLHNQRKPLQESRYWHGFNRCLLEAIGSAAAETQPTLVLWGKIARVIQSYEVSRAFQVIETEHPYNISFINNPTSLALFRKLKPLRRR